MYFTAQYFNPRNSNESGVSKAVLCEPALETELLPEALTRGRCHRDTLEHLIRVGEHLALLVALRTHGQAINNFLC